MADKDKQGAHFAEVGTFAEEVSSSETSAPKHAAPKHAAPEVVPLQTEVSVQREARFPWRAVAAVALVLATFAGIYLAGVYVFSERFMPNTTLDGQDVSLLTLEEVAEGHGAEASDYVLTVSCGEFEGEVSASDVALKSDGMVYAREAISQIDPWRWPMALLEHRDLNVEKVATFDSSKLEKTLGAAIDTYNTQATKPVDAKAAFDEESGLYKVEPAQAGTALDRVAVLTAASEAIATLEPALSLGEDGLQQPAVATDDAELNAAVESVNATLGATQTLKVGEEQVFVVDGSVMGRFVTVSKDLKVTLDQEALREWCQGELSDQFDTWGRRRSYTRPDGKQVSVDGGMYGWNIDGATLAETIAANVLAGKAAEVEIPMLSTAERWNPGGQDWGARYIDIDLSEQHVRMYGDDGNLIWESDCVTGKAGGHETPTGVYQLNDNKEQGEIRLEGLEDKNTGKPEYVSYVTYWMPFIWNAVALHDATWRYSFGGDIWRYDGSHGCVNLPYDKAEALFGICRVGDVVVVHY